VDRSHAFGRDWKPKERVVDEEPNAQAIGIDTDLRTIGMVRGRGDKETRSRKHRMPS
jgi:hypothetical protein